MKTALKSSLILLMSIHFSAGAQHAYFCDSVSANGDPVGLNQYFFIPQEGGEITILLKLPYIVNADTVEYRFFGIDSLTNEIYLSTVPLKVEKEWLWFWKKISFSNPGRYKLYAYADKQRLICTENVDVYLKR